MLLCNWVTKPTRSGCPAGTVCLGVSKVTAPSPPSAVDNEEVVGGSDRYVD